MTGRNVIDSAIRDCGDAASSYASLKEQLEAAETLEVAREMHHQGEVTAPDCQRWRDRVGSYRPAGEPIRTAEYELAPIATDREARAFVERHHYSGSYPAACARYGLHRRGGQATVTSCPTLSYLCTTQPLRPVLQGLLLGHGLAK